MKNQFDSVDQVNKLREIQALRKCSPYPHIVKLIEVLQDEPTGRLALVFELMDMNMQEAIRGRRHYLPESRVKQQMQQLLKSIEHIHKLGIFHRDIKPENILIQGDTLKLADFGSCRGKFSNPPLTEQISTRWQRAPECLLTDGQYDYKMDIWGMGCVFFEVLCLFPLFPGSNEIDQINKIHNILGTPNQHVLNRFKVHASHMDFNFPNKVGTGLKNLMNHVSEECVEFISKILAQDPEERLTAEQALRDPYFHDLRELDKRMTMQLNLSNQEVHNEKTENDDEQLSPRRKGRSTKPVKMAKLNQAQKGSSDDESDLENNNTSINLPKINPNLAPKVKDNFNNLKNLNSKTLQNKKNQLNTNNSNVSLQNNNRKYQNKNSQYPKDAKQAF